MRAVKLAVVAMFLATLCFGLVYNRVVSSQVRNTDVLDDGKFMPRGAIQSERQDGLIAQTGVPTEAPAGFDNLTNGLTIQGPAFDTLDEDNAVPLRSFNDDRFAFEETEVNADGLGPTYNAQSCRECHQNVATGGASQITEQRTGHVTNGQFFEAPGGSLIHSRAIDPEIVERVDFADQVRTFRISTNTLGDGFIEAIANDTLISIRNAQPNALRGSAIIVSVLEANNAARIGRFGWKAQHASLQSFAADAYLNEMGITSPLLPTENTSSGRDISAYDLVADPEDDGEDVLAFAEFMRSTKAPSRGPITNAVRNGETQFKAVGCNICHTDTIVTAATGTLINGGAMTVPAALGNKTIHPYSDFLLHDIDSGDGIPFLPTPNYAFSTNMIKTAPLWGLRTRSRLMHDGLSFALQDVIARHGGQASAVTARYNRLTNQQKNQLIAFLNSL